MARFRKKPVVVEAFQWIEGATSYPAWLRQSLDTFCVEREGEALLIKTLEGVMRASPGDWIVQGVQGEFYPVKPDIFAATYEPEEA
jgi:hypothetical protein